MIKTIKTIETISKITFALVFALVIFSSVSAQTDGTSVLNNQDESIYKYNALENKLSFIELAEKSDILIDQKSETGEFLPESNKAEPSVKEELRAITDRQNFSTSEIRKAVSALEDRSEVATFLVGNNLAVLRFQIVQIREQMILLENLAGKTDDPQTKIQISNQIDSLKAEQEKVEEFVSDRYNEFSLFGWFTRLL